MSFGTEKDQERRKKRLKALLALPENKTCCECNQRQPQWASVNLGVFFCIRCSGIHRNLGVHISVVRSITLDSWKDEWVNMLEQVGNGRGSAYWEAISPGNRKPDERCTDHQLEQFIRDKYVKGVWRGPEENAPHLAAPNQIQSQLQPQQVKSPNPSIKSPQQLEQQQLQQPQHRRQPQQSNTTNNSTPQSSQQPLSTTTSTNNSNRSTTSQSVTPSQITTKPSLDMDFDAFFQDTSAPPSTTNQTFNQPQSSQANVNNTISPLDTLFAPSLTPNPSTTSQISSNDPFSLLSSPQPPQPNPNQHSAKTTDSILALYDSPAPSHNSQQQYQQQQYQQQQQQQLLQQQQIMSYGQPVIMNGGYGMLYGQHNPYANPSQPHQPTNHNTIFGQYSYSSPAQSGGVNRTQNPQQQNQDVFAGFM